MALTNNTQLLSTRVNNDQFNAHMDRPMPQPISLSQILILTYPFQ